MKTHAKKQPYSYVVTAVIFDRKTGAQRGTIDIAERDNEADAIAECLVRDELGYGNREHIVVRRRRRPSPASQHQA